MMTASAQRVNSAHATTPREAKTLQKMAAAEAREPDAAAGDENKPANGVTKAPKLITKKQSSQGNQKQQPSESDEAGEEEDDDDGNEDDDDEDDKSKSPSKDDNKSATDKDDDDDDKKSSKKSRRELPPHTVAILKGWMLSPEHVKHPYPTDEDKQMLLKKTGINMKQLTNWFTNARKRIWKPMMRREHSRQLQTAMEYEKARPRDAFSGGPVPAMPPYRDGGAPYPPRAAIRHSFDAGSLAGPPPYHHHPYDMAPPLQQPHPGYGVPPHAAYPPRVGRSVSESGYGEVVEEHMDAMRIRKRPHEVSTNGVDGGDGQCDKRYRRTAMLSPRCLKILQDWVAVHAHMEYPLPSDSDKLQLSRDTGLDVQQIELWFRTNVGRYGVPLQQVPPPPPMLQQQASAPMPHGHPAYRSIPSRDNPMYPPPPAYGERRSIPAQGNSMFPPRPSPSVRSSIPGTENPQFPPPPAVRREASEGYRPGPGMARPGYQGYPPHPHQGYEGEAARPMRTMSINSAQYGHPAGLGAPMQPMPTPVGAPGSSASGLPSLTGRSMAPGARSGPPMGQARDSRSHTLDMGQFAESRRRNMNFQDILASTSSPAPVAPRPPMGGNGYDATRPPPNAENRYPTEVTAPYTQKMYEPSRNPSPSVPHPDVAAGEPQVPR